MHMACCMGRDEIAEMLLDGAEPNAKAWGGIAPLHLAASTLSVTLDQMAQFHNADGSCTRGAFEPCGDGTCPVSYGGCFDCLLTAFLASPLRFTRVDFLTPGSPNDRGPSGEARLMEGKLESTSWSPCLRRCAMALPQL